MSAAATNTDALDALWECACSPATNALVNRMRERLDHELRDEPRPRYSNIEPNTGLRRYGEI